MHVRDYMTTDVATVPPSATVHEAHQLMHDRGIRHLPVVEGDALVGVVSNADLTRATVELGQSSANLPFSSAMRQAKVSGFMTGAVDTTAPDALIDQAARQMHDRRISCLPVIDDGRLVGILTYTDLVAALASL